jgi:hypothetical protein
LSDKDTALFKKSVLFLQAGNYSKADLESILEYFNVQEKLNNGIIMDDPEADEGLNSNEERNKLKKWFTSSLIPIGLTKA